MGAGVGASRTPAPGSGPDVDVPQRYASDTLSWTGASVLESLVIAVARVSRAAAPASVASESADSQLERWLAAVADGGLADGWLKLRLAALLGRLPLVLLGRWPLVDTGRSPSSPMESSCMAEAVVSPRIRDCGERWQANRTTSNNPN